jgi:hypothetical protein
MNYLYVIKDKKAQLSMDLLDLYSFRILTGNLPQDLP